MIDIMSFAFGFIFGALFVIVSVVAWLTKEVHSWTKLYDLKDKKEE